ncbi:amidase family protein [Oceanibaculum pacificum]|uniref:amidase family protein n=1 Tax=Oceanibaculum pacificum TaxID=580166 RepID=UPI000AD8427C|nr:amidase family protein [Oceanibaculum pacificum]
MTSKHADLCYLSATELLRHYQRKTLSPVEVTKAVLARIEAVDRHVNAFCLVDHDAAIAAARTSEARWMQREPRGMVDGIPATVKDLLLSDGWPTLRGSKTVDRNRKWSEDAPAVARLREEGAVLLGKTTTPEYGWKGVTDSPVTGITRNPWDTSKTPGGSSGGAAAAAALAGPGMPGMPGMAPGLEGMAALAPPEEEEDDILDTMIDITRVEGRVRASSLRKIGEIVDKHPEEAVSILRNWMYQDQG